MGILRRDDGDDVEPRRYRMRRSSPRSATTSGSRTRGQPRVQSRREGPAAANTFVLEDAAGREVAKIQERKLTVRDKVAVERDGHNVATVHKALVGIRDRFAIDIEGGPDLKAHGNIVDHEYEIERDGDTVARISKRWFRVRDTYGIEVAQDEDEALVLATVVALEQLTDSAGRRSKRADAPRRTSGASRSAPLKEQPDVSAHPVAPLAAVDPTRAPEPARRRGRRSAARDQQRARRDGGRGTRRREPDPRPLRELRRSDRRRAGDEHPADGDHHDHRPRRWPPDRRWKAWTPRTGRKPCSC